MNGPDLTGGVASSGIAPPDAALQTPMLRVAVLSLHTSPLSQPGVGDAGGMNVYVRELSSALAHTGADCTVYARKWHPDLPAVIEVEPNFRVVYVTAGNAELPKEALPGVVDEFADAVRDHVSAAGGTDVLHANYWLSGLAGHRLKHELEVPLVSTFHTLARVKAQAGDFEPAQRVRAEAEIIGCSDVILASCTEEAQQFRRLYGEPPGRIEIVSPGVEHAFFAPGDCDGARRGLGLGDEPMILFVGRIQPLKGADVAVRALSQLNDRSTRLVIVGGASGPGGPTEEVNLHKLVAELGLVDRVRFVAPQPHHLLSSWYRAADLVMVPSRSESFGLVALEAAACGTPVVASAVGGLRTLVEHGRTGFLVEGRDPAVFAAYADEILTNSALAWSFGVTAAARARRYTWSAAAQRLHDLCHELTVGRLVACA
jgi:D-inositol-3-phosphate glycosyltransferase